MCRIFQYDIAQYILTDSVKIAERIAGLQSIEKAVHLLYMSLSAHLFSIR